MPGVADAVPVVIDSQGQLGTISSSRRFKEEIADMGELTDRLLELRPVVFRYRPEVLPRGHHTRSRLTNLLGEAWIEQGRSEEAVELLRSAIVEGTLDSEHPLTLEAQRLLDQATHELTR